MPRTTSRQLLRVVGFPAFVLGVLALTTVGPSWAENPVNCSEPEVEIAIREFLDTNDDGTPDVALELGAAKNPGDVILYQAVLSHADPDRCGFEFGRLCIDTPQLGCADAGGAFFDPPSFTTVGPGECCAADLITPVLLVCDPAICVPATGVAKHFSDFVRYVVNPADEANPPPPALVCPAGCPQVVQDRCEPGELRAHAYYDRGVSKQDQDVIPANASIPICNPVVSDVRHFMCYEPDKKLVNTAVTLVDRFGVNNATIRDLKRICNPADKNGEDPAALAFPDHLALYELDSPPFANVDVDVINQFGTMTIELTRRTRMLVPTSKGALGDPPGLTTGQPNPLLIDHFQCYAAKGSSPNENVLIDDQFNPSGPLPVQLRRPRTVCVPADKNDEGYVNANGPDGTGLVCYEANADRQEYRGEFYMENQLTGGPLLREVHGPRELCIQSTIVLLP